MEPRTQSDEATELLKSCRNTELCRIGHREFTSTLTNTGICALAHSLDLPVPGLTFPKQREIDFT